MDTSLPLLREVRPALAADLEELLRDAGEERLARSVPGLRVHGPCRCGETGCASLYTAPPPEGGHGPGHRNLSLPWGPGMLVLDVAGGRIAFLEVLPDD
ncbi:hypothetical protein J0910_14585 [Nocardiopsis sp. CNT-189]|uniref:hypothetical protein n=1 Tax=Nocardiopsis oceanisediminis TaxID=2816862 RepID=UPI003B2CCBF6